MKKPKPVEPIMRSNILRLAQAYARQRKINLTTLSGYCHGDPPFLEKLQKKACSFTVRKYDSILGWFFENWPEGLKMPEIREAFPTPVEGAAGSENGAQQPAGSPA